MLILIGPDAALLEGLTQLLAGAGHRVHVVRSVADAEELARATPPLLVVVDRETVAEGDGGRVAALPLCPGGAIVLYRGTNEVADQTSLPHALARLTLADLTLPLERQRLVALAQYVRARARESGRVRFETPPERHRAHP